MLFSPSKFIQKESVVQLANQVGEKIKMLFETNTYIWVQKQWKVTKPLVFFASWFSFFLTHLFMYSQMYSQTGGIDPPQIQGSEVVRSKVHVSGKTRTPKFTAAKAKVVRDKPVMTWRTQQKTYKTSSFAG